jgi:hypothetical protein
MNWNPKVLAGSNIAINCGGVLRFDERTDMSAAIRRCQSLSSAELSIGCLRTGESSAVHHRLYVSARDATVDGCNAQVLHAADGVVRRHRCWHRTAARHVGGSERGNVH